jgi:hypothetical protein
MGLNVYSAGEHTGWFRTANLAICKIGIDLAEMEGHGGTKK